MNADLDPDAVRELYQSADALVCPSRGEGFGLPLAEAMALGKPIITTAYGGQNDFCTPQTAWLCDYSFAYAKTHLGVFDSVWVEPNPESLTRVLQDIFRATAQERAQRAEAGRRRILPYYTWDCVAQRTRTAVAQVRNTSSTEGLRLPVIGLVSTWNSRCGIASYAQSLVGVIDHKRLHVFASRVAAPLQPDENFVRRCWIEGREDPLDELFQEIRAASPDAVVIQFNFGFFHLAALQRLIERLHEHDILVFITLHSTTDVVKPGVTIRLADIRQTLATVCRLLVHSVHDLNRLKATGLIENVTLFPMGLPEPFSGDRAAMRRSLGLEGKTVIGSFGFLLPHKGLRELIGATAKLRVKVPNIHLLLLNSLYPVPDSESEARACMEEISRLGIKDNVTFVTSFLNESEVLARLAAADVIVYPYQNTQESASAAVKMGLSSLTPVAVTPLPIFADVAAVTHTLPGTTAGHIASGLAEFLKQTDNIATRDKQKSWVAAHAWPHLSARLDGLIRGELRTKSRSEPLWTSLPQSRDPNCVVRDQGGDTGDAAPKPMQHCHPITTA